MNRPVFTTHDNMNLKSFIIANIEAIRAFLKRGSTYSSIAEQLSSFGIKTTANSLKQQVYRLKMDLSLNDELYNQYLNDIDASRKVVVRNKDALVMHPEHNTIQNTYTVVPEVSHKSIPTTSAEVKEGKDLSDGDRYNYVMSFFDTSKMNDRWIKSLQKQVEKLLVEYSSADEEKLKDYAFNKFKDHERMGLVVNR